MTLANNISHGTLSLRVRGIVSEVGIGAIDQAALSITNFVIVIVVIRCVSKYDYGLYVFWYSLVLLANGIHNALVNTQMAVVAPKMNYLQKQSFCHDLAVGQYVLWLPLSFAGLLSAWALFLNGILSSHEAAMAEVVFLAIPAIFLREFYRNLLFVDFRPLKVLLQDMFYILISLSLFFLFAYAFPSRLDILAFLAIGAASLIVGAAGLLGRLRTRQTSTVGAGWFCSLGRCWVNGRWALLGVGLTWAQKQSYVYMLLFMRGAENTAEVNAARLMLMPVGLLLMSYGRIFMPQWAQDRSCGRLEDIFRSARKILKYLICAIIFYGALLWVSKNELMPKLLGPTYTTSSHFLVLWGLIFTAQAVRTNYSYLLQVFEKFRYLSIASFFVTIITIASSAVLITLCKDEGSLLAMLLGEALLALLFGLSLRRLRR